MSTFHPTAAARPQPKSLDATRSTFLEEAVSILRRAIDAPRWDARFVQVEALLPPPPDGTFPSLLDALPDEDAVYWATPAGETSVGLGAVHVIEARGLSRFEAMRDAARDLPSWARLFAGFSFRIGDRGFGDARAVLPRFVVRHADGECRIAVWFDREHHDERTRAGLRESLYRLLARWRTGASPTIPRSPESVAESIDECKRFTDLVADARRHIRAGAFDKVMVHRQTHTVTRDVRSVSAVLRSLDQNQRNSTRFAFRVRGVTFLGATPERLIRRSGRFIAADVLAGSLPRSLGTETPETLLASEKDRSEHELTRSAIADLLGPRCVELRQDGPHVQTLPNLFHLHTAVEGELRRGDHVLDLVAALHPTPAVGGAPRAAALEYISGHEPDDRGWYAAPVGWFAPDGDGDFCVALRCARIEGTSLTLYAGAGIVADSDPQTELAETSSKRRAIAGALEIDLQRAKAT